MSRWAGLLVVVLAVAACTPVRLGDPIPSNLPKPDLAGRILAFDHGDGRVVEVKDGVVAVVVDGVIAADLSPDRRQLAYVRHNGALVRRDLATGVETAIAVSVPASKDCLSWSPDGGRLVFIGTEDDALYVTTVDGVATRVDVPKQQRYVASEGGGFSLPLPDPQAPGVVMFSEITCGRWLDDRRLVFDRVVDMPGSVTFDEEPTLQVPADTTTVAVLDPLELVDSPKRWLLLDRCGDYIMTFVNDGTKGETYVLNPVTVGDDLLGDTGWTSPDDGKLPSARAAFIDGSCDVLLLFQAPSDWHPISRYDVATGKAEKLKPIFDDDHNPPLLSPYSVVVNSEGTAWAVADEETLFAFNLETGGSTFMSSAGLVGKVLGWLPS